MTYHFHVGQQVVCVDSKPRNGFVWSDNDAPEEGRIYTISEIYTAPEGKLAFHLEEISRGPRATAMYGRMAGYGAFRFRPVRTTSIEIFERLLAPSPKKERIACP